MKQKLFTKIKWSFIFIGLVSTGLGCGDKGVLLPQTPPPGFVLIQAGSFTMGSPDGVGDNDEHPQHKVTLSAFYLDTTELTRNKFLPFLESRDTSYLAVDQRKEKDYDETGWVESRLHPIVNVTWVTSLVYCNWLTKKMGSKDTCYTFTLQSDGTVDEPSIKFDRTKRGYRLPTEAEWEYACRAGTTTNYSFNDGQEALSAYSWYRANSEGTIHVVGEKKANAFGLYDMHGNVWEWCWDWVSDGYANIDQTNPVGPSEGYNRVIRGGSWNEDALYHRSANRNSSVVSRRYNYTGFRLAKTM